MHLPPPHFLDTCFFKSLLRTVHIVPWVVFSLNAHGSLICRLNPPPRWSPQPRSSLVSALLFQFLVCCIDTLPPFIVCFPIVLSFVPPARPCYSIGLVLVCPINGNRIFVTRRPAPLLSHLCFSAVSNGIKLIPDSNHTLLLCTTEQPETRGGSEVYLLGANKRSMEGRAD